MGEHKHEHVDRDRLPAMETSELRQLRRRLQEDVDAITTQLERADLEATVPGTRRDFDWELRARDARRFKEQDLHAVDQLIQERERKAELRTQHTYAFTFVGVARRRLPPLLMEELDLQAKKEMEKPGAAQAYDERLRRRRALHRAARQQADLAAPDAVPDVPVRDEALQRRLEAAEAACEAAQELIGLWTAGEAVDLSYYERLASALDGWSFARA